MRATRRAHTTIVFLLLAAPLAFGQTGNKALAFTGSSITAVKSNQAVPLTSPG